MNFLAWIIFLCAACLEVGGDALIRKGLRSHGILLMVGGFLVVGSYGFVVNIVKWDFSKLLGVYVAVFALISILVSSCFFKETIALSTWLGLGLIIIGGLVIQFGRF